MATLKGVKKTIIEVDFHDLDRFISEVFGIKYECVAYEEWNMRSGITVKVIHSTGGRQVQLYDRRVDE